MRRRHSNNDRSRHLLARLLGPGILFLSFLFLARVSYAADKSPLPGAWTTQQVSKSAFTGTFVRAVPKSDDATDPTKFTSYAQLLPFVDQPALEKYLNGWYGWRNPLPGATRTDTVQNCLEAKDIRSNVEEARLFLQTYQTAEFSCSPEKGNSPELGRVRMMCTPPTTLQEVVHDPLNHVTHIHLSWTREIRSASSMRTRQSTQVEVMGLTLETSVNRLSTRIGSCEDFPEAMRMVGTPPLK